MGLSASTASAPTPESRTCVKCAQAKIVTPESWPYRRGKTGTYAAHGMVCMTCERARRAEYEKRRNKIAALVADVPSVPAKGDKDIKDQQKQALTASKLDVAKALKAGSKVLNEFAPAVLARVLEMFEDPDHPQHIWAVQFLADRILPRKLYEELGGQAAGTGGLGDKRPVVNIQILPAQPDVPGGNVVEGHAQLVEVSALPAPKE